MAISECHYRLLKKLRDNGTLPACNSILNIGQPNWYGDMDAAEIFIDENPDAIKARSSVAIAASVYDIVLGPASHTSIDVGGDEFAHKLDLNAPVDLGDFKSYDLVVNHGTAEHIFNIAQVFRTMHDYCRVGGFMIHESPWTGWIDHGFYSLHPTLFYDVADANGYELPFMAMCQIDKKRSCILPRREAIAEIVLHGGPPEGSMLFVVLKKTSDAAFAIPQQGVYSGKVSQSVLEAWSRLR